MTNLENESRQKNNHENLFRSGIVITAGFALIGALITGYNLAEGDTSEAINYAPGVAIWSLVAGGIFAAQREYLKSSKSNNPNE